MDDLTFSQSLEHAANSEVLAVDTEGYFEKDNKLLAESVTVGLSLAGPDFDRYYPFHHLDQHNNLSGEELTAVAKVISGHQRVVFHNAKHDIIALERLGIETPPFYDTMLMAHWIDENIPNKGLDYLSVMYGGEPKNRPSSMQGIIDILGWAYVPVELMTGYASNDARITWDLFYKLYPEFKAQNFDNGLWDIEQKFSRILGHMELQGVKIDTDLCIEQSEKGRKRLQEITNELGFNPGSRKDMEQFLLVEMKFPVVKRSEKTGNPSFDKFAMETYDEMLMVNNDNRAQLVSEYRGWLKACSSNYEPYVDRLSPDGRLRCNYKMHSAVTTRLSCENPNLQQIPRNSTHAWNGHMKAAFIPEEGKGLWEGDYSQLEFRLAAAYGKEKALIEIFADEKRDVFKEIAAELGMERQDVKTMVYATGYGAGNDKLSTSLGITSKAAAAFRKRYYTTYPGLRRATVVARDKCLDQGYITLWSGRRRHFKNPDMEAHKSFNSAIQGGAAEVVKRTMIRFDEEGLNNEECRMLLQVHDSVVSEIEEGKEKIYLPEIKRIMEDVKPNFGVKFRADIHRWGE